MAAKGLVPVKGNDLVTLLCQLAADADANVAKSAGESLDKLPDNVLLPAVDAPLPAVVLDALASRFESRREVIERLVQNHATHDETIQRIAARCDERTSEIIAVNERRLLGAPAIIEALYKNRHTRMSTADRLVELAARHGLELTGIPAFHAHVEAIRGQLIVEATDEPLPSDTAFAQALEVDPNKDPYEQHLDDGTEELVEDARPLAFRIRDMNASEKIRLALIGDASARAILVRDPLRTVAYAAISSPRMSESEAASIAHSREIGEDILRFIGNKKEWLRHYDIKRALAFNPKTPVGIALRFVPHLRESDLRLLSRSRNVQMPVKTAAIQRMNQKKRE